MLYCKKFVKNISILFIKLNKTVITFTFHHRNLEKNKMLTKIQNKVSYIIYYSLIKLKNLNKIIKQLNSNLIYKIYYISTLNFIKYLPSWNSPLIHFYFINPLALFQLKFLKYTLTLQKSSIVILKLLIHMLKRIILIKCCERALHNIIEINHFCSVSSRELQNIWSFTKSNWIDSVINFIENLNIFEIFLMKPFKLLLIILQFISSLCSFNATSLCFMFHLHSLIVSAILTDRIRFENRARRVPTGLGLQLFLWGFKLFQFF